MKEKKEEGIVELLLELKTELKACNRNMKALLKEKKKINVKREVKDKILAFTALWICLGLFLFMMLSVIMTGLHPVYPIIYSVMAFAFLFLAVAFLNEFLEE